MRYDVLKPSKRGSITLTRKWLKDNLGLENGELILQANLANGAVLLTRFDPRKHQSEQIEAALKELSREQSGESDADTEGQT